MSIVLLANAPRHIRAALAANRISKKISELRKTMKFFLVVSSSLLMTVFIRDNGFLTPQPMVS
jgi:hypothetical protein